MKKKNRVFRFLLSAAMLLSLSACKSTASAPTPAPAPTSVPMNERIASVEIYNKTGRIQREDFYDYSGGSAQISYSHLYSYSDAGYLTEIKKSAGGLGSDKVLESSLYNGANRTQRIVYDASGSTQSVTYWTYDKKGRLTKERCVEMIPAENGYSYAGKIETVTLYDEAGLAAEKSVTAPGDFSRNEYAYTNEGLLCRDSAYHSSDGETFRLFDVFVYEYDSSGNLIRRIAQDAAGIVNETEVLEYNEAGLLMRDTVYSSKDMRDENKLSQRLNEYNEQGRLGFSSFYEGSSSVHVYYEYDSAGNVITESQVRYSSGNLEETVVTTRQYDARSNLVREAILQPDGSERVHLVCKYEYYSDGKIQSRTNYQCQ